MLSFFKPKNPPKVEVARSEDKIVPTLEENLPVFFNELNPEKRVQVLENVFRSEHIYRKRLIKNEAPNKLGHIARLV